MYDILEIQIKKGFEYKGKMFGFYKKKLYRLPYFNNNRYYGIKEIPFKENHYRICRDKVGINKIKFLLKEINTNQKLYKETEFPF